MKNQTKEEIVAGATTVAATGVAIVAHAGAPGAMALAALPQVLVWLKRTRERRALAWLTEYLRGEDGDPELSEAKLFVEADDSGVHAAVYESLRAIDDILAGSSRRASSGRPSPRPAPPACAQWVAASPRGGPKEHPPRRVMKPWPQWARSTAAGDHVLIANSHEGES